LGRARLANATSFAQLRDMEAISPEEARLQMIQDGLMTISMPEKPPKEAKKPLPTLGVGAKKTPERPGQIGAKQPPSMGGDGEVKKSIDEAIEKIASVIVPNIRESLNEIGEDDLGPAKSALLTAFLENDLDEVLGEIVKLNPLSEVELENKEKFPAFLGKAIVYNLINSDHLFSEDVVEDVQAKINKSLDEYVKSFIESQGDTDG
jgi:hypothetical protein